MPIYLPPLRERREDIPPLVEFFLKRYAEQNRREVRRVHPEAMRLLRDHDWPGNVRELQNYVERAVILGDGPELTVEHLPPQLRGESAPRPIRARGGDLDTLTSELVRQGIRAAGPQANDLHNRIVGQVERELIQQVLHVVRAGPDQGRRPARDQPQHPAQEARRVPHRRQRAEPAGDSRPRQQ